MAAGKKTNLNDFTYDHKSEQLLLHGEPYHGSHHNSGHMKCGVNMKNYLVHRLVWFVVTGEWPNIIDHINRDKHDNRFSNLSNGSQADNLENTNNKGYYAYLGKWKVVIQHDNIKTTIGVFLTEKEAQQAVKIARQQRKQDKPTK